MPSARIHEVIALRINEEYNYNEKLLRIGTISPDCWRNVHTDEIKRDKYLSHFWDFRKDEEQANDYRKFYIKYNDKINNPFYFGYLLHLIVDQYWKTNIDTKYTPIINNEKFCLIDGKLIPNEKWLSHFEGVKMQKRLAKKYKLDYLPVKKEEYKNFYCDIDELDINGLFNENGTIDYVNKELSPENDMEESILYTDEMIKKSIEETVNFVKEELKELEEYIKEYKNKVKIAVDIDDTIFSTKELEEYYFKEFLDNHKELNINNYNERNEEITKLFWAEYRSKMAFGKVKDNVASTFELLKEKGYIIDLISARPIIKYAPLMKKLTEYLEENNINYNNLYLGLTSRKDFLKRQNYSVLIDNDLDHIKEVESFDMKTILYSSNDTYNGVKTNNWKNIPEIIDSII